MKSNLKHILAALSGIVCLVIYILTMHPTVGFIDSGELAAVVYTFGVPHPTGYPLFLLLGFIVSHLPLGGSVIYRLNMLSAIESIAAVIVTYYSAIMLLNYIFPKLNTTGVKKIQSKTGKKTEAAASQPQVKKNPNDLSLLIYLLAFFTAILTGFTKTFWYDATQIEVYALHSLFISLIVFYSLKILTSLREPSKKNWLLLALIIGLSAANHSTTIYFLPAVLYMLYLQYKSDAVFTKKLLPYALLLLPGLLLYGILIISSSSGPYLNWSDVSDISNLPDHLRGSDFSQLMFSSTAKFSDNAAVFFKNLPGEFAIISLLFIAAGLFLLWKTFKSFSIYIYLCIIFTLIYSFNYNTIEISSFYLLVFYLFSITVPLGIIYIVNAGKPGKILSESKEPKASISKVIITGLILVIFSAGYNYKENDNSGMYANREVTLSALNSVPQNSVIIVYDWAYMYSASLYFQLVEKVRPDVKVFNIKFLSAPWYLKTISKYYPDIYELIKPEAEEYIKVYDENEKVRAPKLTALVGAFIDKVYSKFPVLVTIDLVLGRETKQFLDKYYLKPDGMLYKMEPKTLQYDMNAGTRLLNEKFSRFEPNTSHERNLFKVIPGMMFETGYYHYNNKNYDLSLKFLDKALEFDPAFRDALNLKAKITQERNLNK